MFFRHFQRPPASFQTRLKLDLVPETKKILIMIYTEKVLDVSDFLDYNYLNPVLYKKKHLLKK